MPYNSFKRVPGGVRVGKVGGGSFVSHSKSLAQAHKTAALRELASEGRLRVARTRKRR